MKVLIKNNMYIEVSESEWEILKGSIMFLHLQVSKGYNRYHKLQNE